MITSLINSDILSDYARAQQALFQEIVREALEQSRSESRISATAGPYGIKTELRPYLSVKEAAELARLAPSTIRLMIRRGTLKASHLGRRVIIAREDLERLITPSAETTLKLVA